LNTFLTFIFRVITVLCILTNKDIPSTEYFKWHDVTVLSHFAAGAVYCMLNLS